MNFASLGLTARISFNCCIETIEHFSARRRLKVFSGEESDIDKRLMERFEERATSES
jgi:hypothetical protein